MMLFQAVAVANSLFCMCYKYNMQVENATILLLLAEMYKVIDFLLFYGFVLVIMAFFSVKLYILAV